jgi:hypothetical protein
MPLFLVVNGDNQDAFVRAPKASEAFKAFAANALAEEIIEPGDVARVFELPSVDGPEGLIDWAMLNVVEFATP